uniref:Uncharacterized protein n=1 Tax=Rangifer tarandus platyrhynchus TaxID=3082113 RepID=A0ACB0F1D5_RANTA|nr:unnamed protein product [Rangifer tarandus platyrhynchus]
MLPPCPGCARSVNNITPTPLPPLTVFREQSKRKASLHSNRPAPIPPASSSTDRSSITSKCGVPTCPRSPQSPSEWPLGPRPSPRAVPDPRTPSPTRALRPRPGNLTATSPHPLRRPIALTGGAGWAGPGRAAPARGFVGPRVSPWLRPVLSTRKVGMRAGPGQRPLEDGRSRSRCGDGGAEWGVEVGGGGWGRLLTQQRGRRREWFPAASGRRAPSRPSAPHPPHQEGAALNPRSVCRPEGGLSSGRDLAGGFEEDLPQPTSPRTPLSRDPGDPAWGWEWEGVRSHPLYIRGPRPSEGTPPAQEFALEEVVGRGGVGVEARFESVFLYFLGFGGGAGEEDRVQRFKKTALIVLLSRTL